MINRTWLGLLCLICLFLVAGCAAKSTATAAPVAGIATDALAAEEAGIGTATLLPLATPVPSTGTPSPPTSTATVTVTSTPTLNPMSIPALRARDYPASEIVTDQELDPGANYRRFYVHYLSDGLKIYALLTIPNGNAPEGGWPAIVFNHGYIPPAQYRTTERYIAYVDSLARSGYVVFRIDYRGHDRSEGRASGAYGDPGYTIDVLNAVSAIQKYPPVNPEKIGMWGHSMGGFLTLRAMVISTAIKAGVVWGGVVASYPDLMTRWRRGPGPTPTPPPGTRRWRTDWIEQYGTPEQNPAFWNTMSANNYLNDLSGPLQLHHSTTDEEVPVEFSQTLNEQVQAAGKTAELFTYPGDNHNISGSFGLAMSRTITFFDTYLK